MRRICNGEIDSSIRNSKDSIEKITSEKEQAFAKELVGYLEERRQKEYFFSDTISIVQTRSRFVEKLTAALASGNKLNSIELLAEKNIHSFKGFFSQTFYDLLLKFRRDEYKIEPPKPSSWWCCRPW